jgi:hypothetical protein
MLGAPIGRVASQLWTALRFLQVRLRFVAVFVIAFLLVGKWQVLRNYWDRLTRPAAQLDLASHAVSLDTEYFCPMDPGVVSDWSGKCGICNMALVRRKKGEAVLLPSGVLARMQLSPYRIQLAGIQTSLVGYRPLVRELRTVGMVSSDSTGSEQAAGLSEVWIEAEVFDKDLFLLSEGLRAEVRSEALPGRPPFLGKLTSWIRWVASPARVTRARIELDASAPELLPGLFVTVRIEIPAAGIEPFRSFPRSPPPLQPNDLRECFVCPEHRQILRDDPGQCPLDNTSRQSTAVMVVSDAPGGDGGPGRRGMQCV